MKEILDAARCPDSLLPQQRGNWTISKRPIPGILAAICPLHQDRWKTYTVLTHKVPADINDIHLADESGMVDDVVMEDSSRELRKHLPIWMAARGRVLVTGLGLGCVVRGLLASRDVEHIDVVEIDADIIAMVGPEFADEERVTIHHGDALKVRLPGIWDFAWHDIWTPHNDGLQVLHAELMVKYRRRVGRQGAWAFPRPFKRRFGQLLPMIGGARERAA